jgi:antitoxin component of MazEF toxin-antitoxin module
MAENLGKDVRKIIRVGSSAAVTLPKEYLEAHDLKIGDKVELIFNEILRIEPVDESEIRRKLGKAEGAL